MIYAYDDILRKGSPVKTWLTQMITDERSAKAIIKLLKEQYPMMYLIVIPEHRLRNLPKTKHTICVIDGITIVS